ncbi:hypothetical protein VB715_06125 [Crocosphaera sp. UHCC 0190]|uniref:hypothetical protein n=1 Tax=Crocosphaera sp. UHCC 0190 TaxID=3110246 RepID=UPI002B21210A|nr:hypothetical protein [Crocosphaera sp. UHCC 0190]MEA5509338.1 hypothetical protein [Crocosphaera sp. UHCC 0190]
MINQSPQKETVIFDKIIQEINLIPTEQQENLLRLIQTFRQAIANNSSDIKLNSLEKKKGDQIQENKAILELLNKWENKGSEQEQTETLAYLQEVLS